MPMIQTDSQHYTDIADAIRAQNESQDVYYPADMAAAIRSLPNGDVDDVTVDGVSVVNSNKVAVLSTFSGATSQDNGTKGFVPAPTSADRDKALKGDGTWGDAGLVDDVQVNGTSVVTNKIAQVKSHKQISQNDYNNLPDSKNSDGILYCVPDGGDIEGDRFCPIIYSNNERIIGVWTDGKPLYQKTVEFNVNISDSTSQATVTLSNYFSDVDKVISYKCADSNGQRILPFHLEGTNVEQYSIGVVVDKGANAIAFSRKSGAAAQHNIIFTLQYTKTTDTPGSGIWGPDGIPMVHYDDTERIIGTWFGETLYQKSYNVTSPSAVNTNALIISLSGIEVVNFFGLWSGRQPINFFYDTGNSISTWINAAKTYMVTRTPYNDYLNVPGIITIQYTKTT